MRIQVKILLGSGETITIEKVGSNRIKTILSFMMSLRKYVSKANKLLEFGTDDATYLTEFMSKYPTVSASLLDPITLN